MSIEIVITNAGRAAVINAQNTGTAPVTVTQVGVGTGKYTANPAQTALSAEIKRIATISGVVVADDTIHVTAQDFSADSYDASEFGLYLADGTLFGVYSQATDFVEKASASVMLLSVDVILTTLNATSITFGDATFVNPPASETVPGVQTIATKAEAETGTNNTKSMTPLRALQLINVFGLGSTNLSVSSSLGSSADLNTHTKTGVFAINAGTIANMPPGVLSGSVLFHSQYDNDDAYQMVFDRNADAIWVRRQFSGTWRSWRSIWDSTNLVKQASASDTTAGRMMAVGAFGLGAAPLATVSTPDLNNVTNTGWYITESSGVLNLPPGWPQGRYFVEVIGRVTDSYCVQRITDVSSASGANVARVAWRRMRNAGTWSGWVEPWTSTNLLKQSNVLDVTPEALMLVGAFGLGGSGVQIPNANCNDALVSGIYSVGGSASNAWPGRVSGDMMFVLRFSETAVQQVAVTRTGNMFARGLVSGVWGSWVEVLNSNNTKKQTSAIDTTAGALLAVGAFGLGSFTANLPVDDLNSLNLTGFFRIGSATANVPAGVLIGSNVLNVQYDNDDRWQIVFTRDSDELHFRRSRAGVWVSWRQFWHTANLVKQSSPTDPTTGAMMAVGAFGLGASTVPYLNAPNLNSNMRTGFYVVSNATNRPADGGFDAYLFHTAYDSLFSGYSHQRYVNLDNIFGYREWVRHEVNGVWTAWREIQTVNNTNQVITGNTNAIAGWSYHIAANSVITLPPAVAAGVGARIRFTKSFGLEPTVQRSGTDLISTKFGTDSSVILVSEREYIFASNGTNWEV